MNREELILHLIDPESHDVLGYGPTTHPQRLPLEALEQWHDADHEPVEGVGPRDEHRHVNKEVVA